MLKIAVFFSSSEESVATYLPGISRRLTAIGFQPVVTDTFKFEDLTKDDQQRIVEFNVSPQDVVEVVKREFSFGLKDSALAVYVKMPVTTS